MDSSGTCKSNYCALVEGNIAVGKSTFLNRLKENLGDDGRIFTEPVELWTNFKGINLLQDMYNNPSRNSFRFQTFVQLSIGSIQHQIVKPPIKVMERSLDSGRYIFTEAMFKLGHIDQIEYNIIDEWFQWLTKISPPADEIIYLRATPETALKRLQQRNRLGESGVSLEYLELIHELHEEWLMSDSNSVKVRVIDQNQSLAESLQTADDLSAELKSKFVKNSLF
jgi:deoxyadenosine/deoxycytidine kinase